MSLTAAYFLPCFRRRVPIYNIYTPIGVVVVSVYVGVVCEAIDKDVDCLHSAPYRPTAMKIMLVLFSVPR